MRLPIRFLISAATIAALAACSGGKGFTPGTPAAVPNLRAHANAACPVTKGGVALIVRDNSGLAKSDLRVYFTSSNPANDKQFQYLNASGGTTVFAPGNAATAFPLVKCFPASVGGKGATFRFPLLPGGRLWIAFGPLPLDGAANGQFVAPAPWTGGPGSDVPFDTVELSDNKPGIFVNLTRVDMLGLPMQLRVNPVAKNVPNSFADIGEKLAKYDVILRQLVSSPPFEKTVTRVPGIKRVVPRIINPSHVANFPDIYNTGGFVKSVATYYKNNGGVYDTSYKGAYCPGSWKASGTDSSFVFTQGSRQITFPISLFTSNYIFADDPSPKYSAGSCEYLLVKILLQELLRGVGKMHSHPVMKPSDFYPKKTVKSEYACVLHNYALHYATYAFAFDDAADQASIIQNTAPKNVVLTIGKIPDAIPTPTPNKRDCSPLY